MDIEENAAIRGRLCYLCGASLGKTVRRKRARTVVLDGKEREVHLFCMKDYNRAMKDFARYEEMGA